MEETKNFTPGQVFISEYPPEAAMWCNENRAYIEEIEKTAEGERQFRIVAIPEPTTEEKIASAYQQLDSMVEHRLDSFAKEKKYANIVSACSYATSSNPTFSAEAAYCVKMRDETYAKCYELINDILPKVQAGLRPIPEWEEIEAQLPVLSWDDVVYPVKEPVEDPIEEPVENPVEKETVEVLE
jgi:hypothetical protein